MTDTTFTSSKSSERATILKRVRNLSVLMDSAFKLPVINKRIGLDSIIGLVPGVGDAVGMLFSAYIIFEAAKLGLPKSVLGRMAFNVAVETILGTPPIIGDIFDAYWKANLRNMRLLERHL